MPCDFFVELLSATPELSVGGMVRVEEEVKDMLCNVLITVSSIALARSVGYVAGVVEERDMSCKVFIKLLSTTVELSVGGKAQVEAEERGRDALVEWCM